LFLSIIGSSLGGVEVATESLVKNDDYGLRRLAKTGFKSVFQLAPFETCATLVLDILNKSESSTLLDTDAVIFASSYFESTSDWPEEVLNHMGFSKRTAVFKLQDACTGFLSALALAKSLLVGSDLDSITIITADAYSKYVHQDESLSLLFSDAASISTLTKTKPRSGSGMVSWQVEWSSESSYSAPSPVETLGIQGSALYMEGSKVFQFALDVVPLLVRDAIRESGARDEEIDWYVHQGSKVVVEAISPAFGVSGAELFRAKSYGNTVGSSLPFQLMNSRVERPFIGLVSFGMGLAARVLILKQTS
jgi:3-oxoacyl-[acyl-carrier-protein] synthase III